MRKLRFIKDKFNFDWIFVWFPSVRLISYFTHYLCVIMNGSSLYFFIYLFTRCDVYRCKHFVLFFIACGDFIADRAGSGSTPGETEEPKFLVLGRQFSPVPPPKIAERM